MPLTTEEQNSILQGVVRSVGCPLTVTDRLEAFAEGVKSCLRAVAVRVSLDKPDEKKKENKPSAPKCPDPEQPAKTAAKKDRSKKRGKKK